MSENQPGPISSNPMPGPAVTPDADGEAQTHAATAPFQLSQEPLSPELLATSDRLADAHAASGSAPFAAPAYEHLGELPASYGTQSVYLVAYDPRQLFAYWDLDPAEGAEKQFSLRICHPDGQIESQVDIKATDAGRYLPTGRPQGTYYVELGSYSRSHTWQVLATSGRVTLPAEGLAGETEPKFATLPFHLSFQRLTELIDGAMGTREDLTLALARLQHGEQPAMSSLLGALSHLSSNQLHTLEMILGEQFAAGSESIIRPGVPSQLFRDRLEALTSPGQSSGDLFSRTGAGGSEALTSGGAFAAGGSEVLSSGGGFGSRALASLGAGFGSEALASLGAGFGSDTLSSGGGFGGQSLLSLLAGMGSETLSSFFAAFAGGSEALSSGMLTAGANSEAWRMAGGGPGLSSGDLSSDRTAMFLHAVESNLEVLSSLFSNTFSSLDSAGSSPGSGGLGGPGGGGSSESVARKKSLW